MTRQCGDCQLCCKLLPVKSIDKGAGVKCEHQRVGKGCMVYAKLWAVAPECRLWSCRWLVAEDTGELRRPDRSHYVIDVMPDYVTLDHDGKPLKCEVAQIWIDPDYPDAHRDPALRAWLEKRNVIGLVRFNNERALALIPPAMMDTGQWLEHDSNLNQENAHTFEQVVDALGNVNVELRP
jgi:hypothetical protein